MTRILRAGSALVPGAVILATASGAAAAPLSSPPSNCNNSFNPYGYTQSALSGCSDVKTFAREAVTALPGGGTAYKYDLNGVPYTYFVPPAGFDALTATAAQLEEYALPPRPTDPAQLAQWKQRMLVAKPVAPPQFLAEVLGVSVPGQQATASGTANTGSSGNWSGYVIPESGTTGVTSTWVEPSYGSSACTDPEAVIWSGIGGWVSGDSTLGQDGTAYQVGGLSNHQAWSEVLPEERYIVAQPLVATAAEPFYASVTWNGSGYQFSMQNGATDASLNYTVGAPAGDYSGLSGEAIVERPTVNGSLPPLANFQTLAFDKTSTNGGYFGSYPASERVGVNMYNGSTELATAGSINSSGGFNDTQLHCS